jgi:oxygen-independent coproporphyrinogen-3 oxidase
MESSQHIRLPVFGQPTGGQVATLSPDCRHPLDESAVREPVRSLYIHVPFCSHKCHYCDFYSFVDTRDQQDAFVERLIEELTLLAPHAAGAPLRTVFIGGGTPSLLGLGLWERLLERLGALFDLSWMGRARGEAGLPRGEFTVECNPESASPELMRLLVRGGVNRISIGAQSFNPRHLRTLERTHDPANVPKALDAARAAGIARVSVDLIFGIPGQTLAEWEHDLRCAMELGTTHVSCYALTYEANTPMTARLKRGEFAAMDEDVETAMFERTVEMLRAAGLERYEVSNFAVPGHESLHNLAYWRQEQWLAAGPSASGHAWAGMGLRSGRGSWRWKNVGRLGDYLVKRGRSPVTDVERPDAARLVRERIMTGLRITEGLDGAGVMAEAEACAEGSRGALEQAARRFEEEGLLSTCGGRWVLTDAGFLLADYVAAELMGLVPASESPTR